jgi:hypothetical protein
MFEVGQNLFLSSPAETATIHGAHFVLQFLGYFMF